MTAITDELTIPFDAEVTEEVKETRPLYRVACKLEASGTAIAPASNLLRYLDLAPAERDRRRKMNAKAS
jgi:hypothetical protein